MINEGFIPPQIDCELRRRWFWPPAWPAKLDEEQESGVGGARFREEVVLVVSSAGSSHVWEEASVEEKKVVFVQTVCFPSSKPGLVQVMPSSFDYCVSSPSSRHPAITTIQLTKIDAEVSMQKFEIKAKQMLCRPHEWLLLPLLL